MPNHKLLSFIILWTVTAFALGATSTHSFTNTSRGSHPNTITGSNSSFTVDMSALPNDAIVYRAVFVHNRSGNTGGFPANSYAYLPLQVEADDDTGVWLPTVPPRHMWLDCTAAVQRAFSGSSPTRSITLNMISFGGFNFADGVRIDVWCDQPAASAVTQVSNLNAIHMNGDTMLTFTMPETFLSGSPTNNDYINARDSMDDTNTIRYRIYRSTAVITDVSIRTAELVDEVNALTGWDPAYYAFDWASHGSDPCMKVPIAADTMAADDTGVYVRRAAAAETAYYAVSRVVDGAEDLTAFVAGENAITAGVSEATGTGMVIQRKSQVFSGTQYKYEDYDTLYWYVRWECPPYFNVPSQPADYIVCVPDDSVDPRPVTVKIHCWGAQFDATAGWWHEAERGALMVATNQIYPHWWTGFHANYKTIRPFAAGVDGNAGGAVENYPEKRLNSFVDDFVKTNWNVDNDKILLTGTSMGGSGTIMWGIREPERWSYLSSWVGVAIPAESPTFTGSFEGVYGEVAQNTLYSSGDPAFDYWDSEQWVLGDPAREMPFISFAHGKNDSGIGWNQAWKFVNALQTTRQPHKYVWGQSGHSQRGILPGTAASDRYCGIVIKNNQTVPAFTNCSQDDNLGNGDPANGDDSGYLNRYLLWEPDTSTDAAGEWEMVVYLIDSSPDASATVDITPRRCQFFAPAPSTVCNWENRDAVTDALLESGTAVTDADGLTTVTGITVDKNSVRRNRINISYSAVTHTVNASAGSGGTISPSGALIVGDGSNVLFTITPDTGYQVSDVTVGGSSVGAVTEYTIPNITADTSIAASFTLIPVVHTVTLTAGSGGTISPSGTQSVNDGNNLPFTVTPGTDYEILDVTVDTVSIGAVSNYTLTGVSADIDVAASFQLIGGGNDNDDDASGCVPGTNSAAFAMLMGIGIAGILVRGYLKG